MKTSIKVKVIGGNGQLKRKEAMKTERRKMVFAALIAVIATFMVGCSHENGGELQPVDNNADIISFSSGSPETRTSYSGYVNNDKERVDWVAGDVVTIWSDKADDHSSAKKNYADYKAGEPRIEDYQTTDDQLMSTAPLSINTGGSSLRWNSTDNNYQFWGAYPASNVNVAKSGDKANTSSPSFSASIPQDQAITAHTYTTGEGASATSTVKYEPSMNYAYMASYKQTAKTDETVKLPFTMAFTAFEFIVKGKDSEFELKDFTLQSGLAQTGTAPEAFPVTGKFTATWSSGTTTNLGWSYAAVTGQTNDKVKITFPEGTKVSETDQVTFTVFALPQDMKNLTAIFTIKDINGVESTKKLSLKTGGDFLTFAGCKKHKIGVLAIPTGWKFKTITLDLKVLDWDKIAIEGDSEDYPQSTQFAVSGEGVKNGYSDIGLGNEDNKDPYRQQWYFRSGQTVEVFFKVMLPAGGSWEVVPVGGSETNPVPADASLFTITNVSPDIDDQHPTVSTNLYGPIAESGSTEVKLQITYTGTGEHSFYFHTYVYTGRDKTGTKFNIDSETQLYDRGRGYHTFIVNSTLY